MDPETDPLGRLSVWIAFVLMAAGGGGMAISLLSILYWRYARPEVSGLCFLSGAVLLGAGAISLSVSAAGRGSGEKEEEA